ncbi:hypothetical protein ACIO3O_08495 [Streptomyces sp. NPDC087440]|uniref:hypothetical protein n=1 Tax=Streptomyces sp. NPDC087440 TaxID=3365790 RepID=UPI00382E30C5
MPTFNPQPLAHPWHEQPPPRWVALNSYMYEIKQIRTEWNSYATAHSDARGRPHDRTVFAQVRDARNAAAWKSFLNIEAQVGHMLRSAKHKVRSLPPAQIESHWTPQLTKLDKALVRLDDALDDWTVEWATADPPWPRGGPERQHSLARRHARSWRPLTTWADHGQALFDICSPSRASTSPPARTVALPLSRPSAHRQGR